MQPMIPVPQWFAELVAAVLLAQLVAAIVWAIRTDRANAVRDQKFQALSDKLNEIVDLLRKHSLDGIRVELDALRREQQSNERRIRGLEAAQARALGREEAHETSIPRLRVSEPESGKVGG